MTANAAGPSVLIIDDEQGILEVIRMLLTNNGFTAHIARGGRVGIEQIEAVGLRVVDSRHAGKPTEARPCAATSCSPSVTGDFEVVREIW